MINSICIYATFKCNLRCDYCINKFADMTLSDAAAFRILRWFLGFEGQKKMISLGGGESFFYFGLMLKISEFLEKEQKKNAARKIHVRDVPTNGTLWRRDQLNEIAARDNLNLAFSFDGFQYRPNRYRFYSKQQWRLALRNAFLYTKYKRKSPLINMTIHPATAQNVFPNALTLLERGFKRIRILQACGQKWTPNALRNFLSGLRQLLLEYVRRGKQAGWSIEPFEEYLTRIASDTYEFEVCGMGEEIIFDPAGNAFPCELTVQMPARLQKDYCLGNIAERIDLEKNEGFRNFKICHQNDFRCHCFFPNMACKRLCLIYDARSWKIISPADISHMTKFQKALFSLCLSVDKKFKSFQPCS